MMMKFNGGLPALIIIIIMLTEFLDFNGVRKIKSLPHLLDGLLEVVWFWICYFVLRERLG